MVIAALYGAGFLIVGLFVPTYSSTSSSTSGGVTEHLSSSSTMVAVNGVRVLGVLALPLVAVMLVWMSLKWQRRHYRLGAGVLAWIVVALLGALSLLALLSIGIFIVPLAVILAIACANAPTTTPKAPIG
jgi:hypothetical protein